MAKVQYNPLRRSNLDFIGGVSQADLTNVTLSLDNKLDKVTSTPQEVNSQVEFFSDITVPSGSVILGKDGAKLSSGARNLNFRDGFGKNNLFPEYSFDDTGGEVPTYYDIGSVFTNVLASEDTQNVGNSVSVLIPFGATLNSILKGIIFKSDFDGDVRVQAYAGNSANAPVLVDITVPVVPLAQRTPDKKVLLTFPNPITLLSDELFVIFSGIDFLGGLQTTGALTGQVTPYIETVKQSASSKLLAVEDGPISILNNDAGYIPDAPSDGHIYRRRNGTWKMKKGAVESFPIATMDGSNNMNNGSFDGSIILLPEGSYDSVSFLTSNFALNVGQSFVARFGLYSLSGNLLVQGSLTLDNNTTGDSHVLALDSEIIINNPLVVYIVAGANDNIGGGALTVRQRSANAINDSSICFSFNHASGALPNVLPAKTTNHRVWYSVWH